MVFYFYNLQLYLRREWGIDYIFLRFNDSEQVSYFLILENLVNFTNCNSSIANRYLDIHLADLRGGGDYLVRSPYYGSCGYLIVFWVSYNPELLFFCPV
jgi:hypothetical protein